MLELSLHLAFTGGLISFLAPCVVPLFPVYLSFITGVSVQALKRDSLAGNYRQTVLFNSLAYCLGFSFTFILLGLVATTLGRNLVMYRPQLVQFGGVLVVLFGLYMLGVFNRFSLSQTQWRLPIGKTSPFLMGTIFALAWTPCIGPLLGAILTLAATSTSSGQGALLLAAYSLGISLPFILVALTLSWSYPLIIKLQKWWDMVSWLMGAILIAIGVLMLTQRADLLGGLF